MTFLGLTETEEKIYKTSLIVGTANIRLIAQKSGIRRSTAYYAIDTLIEKGFLHEKVTSGKKFIEAQQPEYLFDVLAKEKSELRTKEDAIRKIVPQLKELAKNPTFNSEVTYYQGVENVWHIFEDILKERADIYWFGSFGSALEHFAFQELLDRFSKKRRQVGRTKSFVISDPHPLAQKLWRLEDTDFREFRFLPKKFFLRSALIIYNQKIALISFDDPIAGTLIQNNAIAETLRVMFDSLWKSASAKPEN